MHNKGWHDSFFKPPLSSLKTRLLITSPPSRRVVPSHGLYRKINRKLTPPRACSTVVILVMGEPHASCAHRFGNYHSGSGCLREKKKGKLTNVSQEYFH